MIDAWEHAYHLQYLNVRADFVSAVWNLINWGIGAGCTTCSWSDWITTGPGS